MRVSDRRGGRLLEGDLDHCKLFKRICVKRHNDGKAAKLDRKEVLSGCVHLFHMAWIKQFLVLWSIFHESLASKESCSKPNFNVENVDMSEIMETQFEVGRKLRLKCQRGYKRKAGTSNLIKCQNGSEFAKWTDPILQCIRIGGPQPPAPSTSSTETLKDLTPTIHGTSGSHLFTAMTSLATSVEPTSLATSVEPTSLATSVEPTSVEPATSGTTADHYTSTMDITVTSGSHLSPAVTTVTRAAVETTTLTTATRSITISSQTSSVPPLVTDTSDVGLRPLNTTWTAVRPSTSSASTVGTESLPAVPSDRNQRAAAETTITFITSSTTGTEAVTTRETLAERTVNSPTASETTPDIASTITTTDINQTMTAGKSIGLVIGASAGSLFVILLVILFLVWLLVCRNRIHCTRFWFAEHELTAMAPMEVQTVVDESETGPLQSQGER
ncbi:mucin-5AC-like isoform X2 [Pristis pectinata]|uniref:mucin-5AC-like isoform X2 n=1 Tax=Pristis pectinata TaxID=685728 RepID=UPI00223D6EF9|nr:mucin-5AC-like isoform X2 [Pristis pectinata]